MHPWLIEHPPVSTYGFFVVMALVVAWVIARSLAKVFGMDPSRIDLLMPIVVAAGIAGAWVAGWWSDVATGEGAHGTVLYGALLLATAAGIAYACVVNLPLGTLGDVCAPALVTGIALGRVGCLFAGCCFGRVSGGGEGVTGICFPAGSLAYAEQVRAGMLAPGATRSLPVYPVQPYETAGCMLLALLVLAHLWQRRGRVRGESFLWMSMGYAALRFGLEFLRGDNTPIEGLTFSQWMGIVVMVMAAATFVLRRRYAGRWGLTIIKRAASPAATTR